MYLVPFALLKGSSSNEFLYEMFSLLCVPSLASLRVSQKHSNPGVALPYCDAGSVATVVGAPHLPPSMMRRWMWGPLPSAQDEALRLGQHLRCRLLTGVNATKENVVAALARAQCVHFATHVSWKLAAVVLAPSRERTAGQEEEEGVEEEGGWRTLASSAKRCVEGKTSCKDVDSIGENACESACSGPPLQDFLLTAADILELNLSVKLVVLRSVVKVSARVLNVLI